MQKQKNIVTQKQLFRLFIKVLFLTLCLLELKSNLFSDDIFPPFYSREEKTQDDKTVEKISVRPLFTVYRSLSEEHGLTFEQLQLFWPFIFYQKTNERRYFRFFPFAFSINKYQEYGTDNDNFILPFLSWGYDLKEGKYFMFLPFGGIDKGHLGKEKITVVMFPFYAKTEYKGFISTNYFFPFVQTNRGSRHDGWRFWPFYGTYKIFKDEANTKLSEDRKFVFWPFWIKQNRYYDNENIGKSFVSFPFYASYTSNSKNEKMLFWPIYKKTNLPKENGNFYTILWPILKFGKSDTASRFEIFPLYGYKQNDKLIRRFIFWPFIRHEKDDNKYEKSNHFWLLPLFWSHYYYDKNTKLDRRTVKVWPILQYNRKADGEKKIEILSPFWFKDSVKGGFENNYADFFRLFHTKYKKDEYYETKMFFNLFQFKKDTSSRKIRIFPFIYKYERDSEKKKMSILGGLIEYHKNPDRTGFKILWIPFNRYTK